MLKERRARTTRHMGMGVQWPINARTSREQWVYKVTDRAVHSRPPPVGKTDYLQQFLRGFRSHGCHAANSTHTAVAPSSVKKELHTHAHTRPDNQSLQPVVGATRLAPQLGPITNRHIHSAAKRTHRARIRQSERPVRHPSGLREGEAERHEEDVGEHAADELLPRHEPRCATEHEQHVVQQQHRLRAARIFRRRGGRRGKWEKGRKGGSIQAGKRRGNKKQGRGGGERRGKGISGRGRGPGKLKA